MPGVYSQESIAAHFDETNRRLALIEQQLALLSEKAGVPYTIPTAEVPDEVVELARSGKKLEAMKLYRELTKANMDEARHVIAGL